jgi:2,4-dienoyl-CoA reductase-like NADH-dependent reductase (Old Yellow Enzyme family)
MAVMQEGRANPRQLYINEQTADDFARLVERIKTTCLRENGYEPLVIAQLTHSGRYSKPEGVPAPLVAYHCATLEANNPIDDSRIVTDDYLETVQQKLIEGAMLAEKCGFDGADIKCCHRYLLCELLSAYTRPGKFGGSFENRTRLFRTAVAESVRLCGGDFLITSRMNLYDGYPHPDGFGVRDDGTTDPDMTEAIALCGALRDSGVKLLDFTMGNPYFNPHVNRPYTRGGYEAPEHPMVGCERMMRGTAEVAKTIPEVAVISSAMTFMGAAAPHVAAACINEGWFAFAGFGRQTLAYPDLAVDICKTGELCDKKLCLACSKCTEIMRKPGGTPGCVVRDAEVYAPIYKELVQK